MTDNLFLTREDLTELTGYKIPKTQAAALNQMGIQHKIRPDGRVLVLRSHLEKEFDGFADRHIKLEKKTHPNYGAFDS